MKTTVNDPQLGQIELKRFRASRTIRIKLRQDGTVYVTMPTLTPLFVVKKFISSNQKELLKARQANLETTTTKYHDQQTIGASHKIILSRHTNQLKAYSVGQVIRWLIPPAIEPESTEAQDVLRPVIRRVLDRQAKAYLPRRLQHLAKENGFSYNTVRYGNAKGRWGSCSRQGTISLNVALMNLPLEVIDYVLIHELCHTEQMNHSKEFWSMVENCLPDYKKHRKSLRSYSPYL